MDIMLFFGTRPEAIKMCPLIKKLKCNYKFNVKVCVTAQHREMLDQILNVFEIEPDYDMNIMKCSQTLYDLTIQILINTQKIISKEKVDIALVHGDTTTAFAVSLACFYAGIKVGHIEAGLRTYNLLSPFPEEFNRQVIDIISEVYFAPTEYAKRNLIKEGKSIEKIFVTGNTVIDALNTTVQSDYKHPYLDWFKDSKLILLTAHRRENIGMPMRNIFRAIKQIVEEYDDVKVLYPVHKNPAVREIANGELGNHDRIYLIEPLNVIEFHNFMAHSYLIVTDSGGIQEEAPSLGIPVLVTRDSTERQEGIKAGTVLLTGTQKNIIYLSIKKLIDDKEFYGSMRNAINPYGDGKASERIAKILEHKLFIGDQL